MKKKHLYGALAATAITGALVFQLLPKDQPPAQITADDIARDIEENPAAAGTKVVRDKLTGRDRIVKVTTTTDTTTTTTDTTTTTTSTTTAQTTISKSLTMSATGSGRTISVTYNFSTDVQTGQFLDGSYWVVPNGNASAVTIDSISAVGGEVRADENPVYNSQGLTSGAKNYGNHVGSETLSFPLTRSQNAVIVAAIQKDEATYGACGTRAIVGECIDAIFPLTILTEKPRVDELRPPLNGARTIPASLADFDLSKIPYVDYFTPATSAELEQALIILQHQTEALSVWDLSKDTIYSEGGRAWRSDLFGLDYGSKTAVVLHKAWTWVMAVDLNDPVMLEKYKPLIGALLVWGQDLYYAMYNGTQRIAGWGEGAGQHQGKIVPVSMYAIMKYRNSEEYSNISRLITLAGKKQRIPPEIEQINPGVNGPIWGDGPDNELLTTYDVGSYWKTMLEHQCYAGAPNACNPAVRNSTLADPHRYIDGPSTPGTSYYGVTTGTNQTYAAMLLLVPEMRRMYNSLASGELTGYRDAPIIFFNRLAVQGYSTNPDMCAPPDPRENLETCDAYRSRGCTYYGLSNTGTATWGPDPKDLDWSDGISCISNNSGGNTGQNGRFPSYDNVKPEKYYYFTPNVYENWQRIYTENY